MHAIDYTRLLSMSRVISMKSSDGWAGYSPSDGKYWVAGEWFDSSERAGERMAALADFWEIVDKCIDDDGLPSVIIEAPTMPAAKAVADATWNAIMQLPADVREGVTQYTIEVA